MVYLKSLAKDPRMAQKDPREQGIMSQDPTLNFKHLDIRGLFVRLLVDQSTNWSTYGSLGALILVDQMSILVDELNDLQTNR